MPAEEFTDSQSLKKLRADLPGFEIYEWRHASAVLTSDFEKEWNDIRDVLSRFKLKKSHVVAGGGSKSLIAGWIDRELTWKGWREKKFETAIQIDQQTLKSPTHKVDCFKNRVGLEIEWNNKDPFFDRDLNNFRLLFDLRALAVGIIITRSENLTPLFRQLASRGLKSKTAYGESTTHMSKLLPRLEGGAGGGCPVLVIGITAELFFEDVSDEEAVKILADAEFFKSFLKDAEKKATEKQRKLQMEKSKKTLSKEQIALPEKKQKE